MQKTWYLEKSWATDFFGEAKTEAEIKELTLKRYEKAMEIIFSSMAEKELDCYIAHVKNDLSFISLGRLRKTLREAGTGFAKHYPGVQIFAGAIEEEYSAIFTDMGEQGLFITATNPLNDEQIRLEGDVQLQLNARDFLNRNNIEYCSHENYLRTLNIYCALADIITYKTGGNKE
ncbi:hypothetical protein AwErysi_00020 [Erysipelotrichaceae bacterium]|nr:hypothetical protein AwErysi_00020 [Erysipelotrichaceae bacterium]